MVICRKEVYAMSRVQKLLIALFIACFITACWSATQPPVDTSGTQNIQAIKETLLKMTK